MCSVLENEEEVSKLEEKPILKNCNKCMKCKEKALVLVRARDPFCRSCFLNYFTHKVRATLGKSKAIRPGEKVLLAFSGGPASRCMLELMKEGLSENAHKKLKFIPTVIFIYEGAVLGWNDEKRKETVEDIHQCAKNLGFPSEIIQLEMIFSDSCNTLLDGQGKMESTQSRFDDSSCNSRQAEITKSACLAAPATEYLKSKLQNTFNSMKTLTAKQDFLCTLRLQLLLRYAKENHFTKIIVAETLTSLSIKLLSNIAQGRGGALPIDIGVVDSRDEKVAVIRPMREVTLKEVAFYNRVNKIEAISIQSIDTMEADNSSLQRQTEAFVINLQANFPSTVSTIFRTGDKLTLSDQMESADHNCIMCKVPIHVVDSADKAKNEDECAAENAADSGCCGKGDGSCFSKQKTTRVAKDDITERLCYGCRLTFRDLNYDTNLLPEFVIEEAERIKRRFSMKDTIQDFLLE